MIVDRRPDGKLDGKQKRRKLRACATLSTGESRINQSPKATDFTAGSLRHVARYLINFAETTTTSPLSPMVVLPTTTFSPWRKPTGERNPTF